MKNTTLLLTIFIPVAILGVSPDSLSQIFRDRIITLCNSQYSVTDTKFGSSYVYNLVQDVFRDCNIVKDFIVLESNETNISRNSQISDYAVVFVGTKDQSYAELQGTIYHECGHIVHQHKKSNSAAVNHANEFQADHFATTMLLERNNLIAIIAFANSLMQEPDRIVHKHCKTHPSSFSRVSKILELMQDTGITVQTHLESLTDPLKSDFIAILNRYFPSYLIESTPTAGTSARNILKSSSSPDAASITNSYAEVTETAQEIVAPVTQQPIVEQVLAPELVPAPVVAQPVEAGIGADGILPEVRIIADADFDSSLDGLSRRTKELLQSVMIVRARAVAAGLYC